MQHTLALFGENNTTLLFIFAVILLLFGGKKIPELARSFGKGVSEFKKGIRDVENDVVDSANEQPAPPQPPIATAQPTQPAQSQPFRFDPYTGKPITDNATTKTQ